MGVSTQVSLAAVLPWGREFQNDPERSVAPKKTPPFATKAKRRGRNREEADRTEDTSYMTGDDDITLGTRRKSSRRLKAPLCS